MANDSGKRPFLLEGKLLRDPSKGSGLWGTLGHQELSLEQCLCRSLDDEGQALRDDEAADSSLPLGASPPAQSPPTFRPGTFGPGH